MEALGRVASSFFLAFGEDISPGQEWGTTRHSTVSNFRFVVAFAGFGLVLVGSRGLRRGGVVSAGEAQRNENSEFSLLSAMPTIFLRAPLCHFRSALS